MDLVAWSRYVTFAVEANGHGVVVSLEVAHGLNIFENHVTMRPQYATRSSDVCIGDCVGMADVYVVIAVQLWQTVVSWSQEFRPFRGKIEIKLTKRVEKEEQSNKKKKE